MHFSSSLSSPSFADILLITLHPSFLQSFMTEFFRYSLQWRHEFNHAKSIAVTYGESKPLHLASCHAKSKMGVK